MVFPADHDPSTPAFEANALPYATALAGACPWLGVQGNLLPPSLRRTSSRVRLIPTIVLASTLVILVIALAFRARLADARYLWLLQHEISRYETQARRVEALDRRILATRERSQSLDEFRRRPKLDIDAISDITKLISPPGWVSSLDMDRNLVQIGGEAEQAAPLLSAFDKSLYFEKSEFTMPISRSAAGDMFRIKAQRQTPPLMAAPRQTAQAPGPEQPAATPAPGVSK